MKKKIAITLFLIMIMMATNVFAVAKATDVTMSIVEDNVCTIKLNEKSEKLIKYFMPGPITLVLKKNKDLPEYVTNGKDTIAIRMATSETIKKLILELGSPIFMTSANQSGEPTCNSLDEIEKMCPNLDGIMEGNVIFSKGSTIIDCSSDDIKILREGPITIEQINEIVNYNLRKRK